MNGAIAGLSAGRRGRWEYERMTAGQRAHLDETTKVAPEPVPSPCLELLPVEEPEIVETRTCNARMVVFTEWFRGELDPEVESSGESGFTGNDYWKVGDEDADWLRRNRDGLLPLLLDEHELRAVRETRYHAEDKR